MKNKLKIAVIAAFISMFINLVLLMDIVIVKILNGELMTN